MYQTCYFGLNKKHLRHSKFFFFIVGKPINCTFRSPCSASRRESRSRDLNNQDYGYLDVFRHIQNRQYGGKQLNVNQEKLLSPYVSKHIPPLLAEKEFELGKINKIFSSHWLDDRQVAMGTKCNKVWWMICELCEETCFVDKRFVVIPLNFLLNFSWLSWTLRQENSFTYLL